jgi:WD40 repeat protein
MIHDESLASKTIAHSSQEGVTLPHVVCPADDSVEAEQDLDIKDMVRLLDQVWPRPDPDGDEMPRRFGRFSIIGELGRGGFGVVYLAEDPLLKRRVALKLPRIGVLSGSESWRRFLREAQATSRLDHPNVIPLLEAGTVGPVGYIVSAYVAGPSLEQWLRHQPRGVSPRWGALIVAALARAIEHAHERGILHRDLKPANIVLYAPECAGDGAASRAWEDAKADAWSWVPRICDFGMAKLREAEGDETRSRIACGSPAYMAPEQAESRQNDIKAATDVYGLGAVLYQILTGRPPFSGTNDLDTLRQVVGVEPAGLRNLRPGLPRDLETICLKCLAKRPGQRYADAAALADDLERFLDGRPIRARPVAAWERGWRWVRRHPASASLVTAVVIAVAAGIGGLLWHDTRLGQVNEKLRLSVILAQDNAQEARSQKSRAETHERSLGRRLAGHQIFAAQQAVAARDFERALRMLDAAESEFGAAGNREFAWTFLRQFIRDRFEILGRHREEVNWIAASPDGHSIASGDETGEVSLWDLQTRACRTLGSGKSDFVSRLVFSPDGRALAAVTGASGEVTLWDVASGRMRGTLAESGHKGISTVLFSRDGGCLAAVGREPGPGGYPFDCWDVNGSTSNFPIVAAEDNPTIAALLTDTRLQSLAKLMDDPEPSSSASVTELKRSWVDRAPRGVARTRDQSVALVAAGDGAFDVYDVAARLRMATGRIHAAGTALVLFDSRKFKDRVGPGQLAQVETLAERLALESSQERQPSEVFVRPWFSDTTGAFSPDGRRLAFWRSDLDAGLNIIDLTTGLVCATFDLAALARVTAITFTGDGASLAFGAADGKVRLWRLGPVRNPHVLRGHTPKEAWSLAFSPDGHTLASAGDDNRVRLWNVQTGEETAVLRGHYALVSSVAFSRDGHTLASASFDTQAQVAIWDVATRSLRWFLRGHTAFTRSISFSPDGRTVASGSDDGSVRLWDVSDAQRAPAVLPQPGGVIRAIFSVDGRTLASTYDHRIILTDLKGGGSRVIDTGITDIISLVYSHDGAHLTAGHVDGLIDTWDVATGRQVGTLPGHSSWVLGLALSPDGRTLASAGADRTVRVWDVSTSQELLCLTDCKARVNAVAFSPDGSILAAADHGGAITLWRTRP